LGNLPKLKRLVLNDRTVGDEVLQRIRVMAKKSRNVVSPVAVQRTSDGALHRREVAGVAPAKHPGWKPMGSPSRTLDDKSAPGPKATYDVASLPKDLPQTPIVKQPAVASSTPQGEGMMLEFGAKPSGERSSRRRLTGLKRLHQLELTQGARDLDLQPGASANIKSFEATESNSLGEITINAR
jgi:hypothetical protein